MILHRVYNKIHGRTWVPIENISFFESLCTKSLATAVLSVSLISHTPCTDGQNVALQVWDIGGQSIGGRMLDKYIYGSHVSEFHTHLTVH